MKIDMEKVREYYIEKISRGIPKEQAYAEAWHMVVVGD